MNRALNRTIAQHSAVGLAFALCMITTAVNLQARSTMHWRCVMAGG